MTPSLKIVLLAVLLYLLTFDEVTHASDEQAHTITVYINVGFTSRKKRGAKALTKSHLEYQKKGYRFVDLELYVENGDLQGFFVTYSAD